MRRNSPRFSSPRLLFTLLVSLVVFSSVASAAERRYSQLVVFGDSLSDPGNHFAVTHQVSVRPYEPIPDASYAIGGFHFSNGETWIEQVAGRAHLPSGDGPALRVLRVFTNYAFGAARARAVSSFDLS